MPLASQCPFAFLTVLNSKTVYRFVLLHVHVNEIGIVLEIVDFILRSDENNVPLAAGLGGRHN